MSQQDKRVQRRLIQEVWNQGNYDVVDELIAVDYIGHSSSPADETRGPGDYKQFYASLRRAFPNLTFTIEDQIAEGDRVVTRWTARGRYEGEFQGIPPTGRKGTVTAITIDRIASGKIEHVRVLQKGQSHFFIALDGDLISGLIRSHPA